jgi:glycosyltransferase involved in cell wall biosynthesis
MLVPPENGSGIATTPEPDTTETRNGHGPHALSRRTGAMKPAPEPDGRPALALLCFDGPESAPARFLCQLAEPLSARGVAVHLFTNKGLDAPGAVVHVLGEGDGGDLLGVVQEFTHRACNAFLRQFQGATAPVTVMACEWSAVQAMSILRGIKGVNTILSLHSLERQRSDMTGELSQAIESIELTGLREARGILVHEPGTAEAARYWVPECADRTTCVRPIFPAARFQRDLDPGAIKARYQVGPVDPTILYVGDLEGRYGPDLLVKAMPPILKNKPQARLVAVGAGADFWPLRVYARYLLLEHAVRLPGSVEGDALDELIQAADVIAVPSREATPWWPILAGWAARRPVVATHEAAPGLPEHERDAVLFYPNVNSCVWGVERVLHDAEFGRALGERGRRKLDERFGWGGVAAQVEELMAARAAR